MLKSDRLVCEKNAAKAQPVTNYNLESSILIVTKLSIVRGKICNNTKNEVSMSTHSKVIAQTDRQTDTHTYRHNENITCTTYVGGNKCQMLRILILPIDGIFIF